MEADRRIEVRLIMAVNREQVEKTLRDLNQRLDRLDAGAPLGSIPLPGSAARAKFRGTGRSRLTRLAGELEDRHGPGRAAPGAPESLIDRAARKLG